MYKRDHKVRAGNDRFEGFAVDLIAEVAQMLNFDYDIYLVHDDKFGNKMHDGNWNGMIGELLAGVRLSLVHVPLYHKDPKTEGSGNICSFHRLTTNKLRNLTWIIR